MATRTWTSTTANWNVASHWAGGLPVASDTVLIGNGGTSTFSVTIPSTVSESVSGIVVNDGKVTLSLAGSAVLDVSGDLLLTAGSVLLGNTALLAVNGTLTDTAGTIKMAAGSTLTGGTIDLLTGGSSIITGAGELGTAATRITGAGSIVANAGTLDVLGGIAGGSAVLGWANVAGSVLKIDANASALSASLGGSGRNETLEIGAGDTLTLAGALVATAGVLKLDSAASGLTDLAGINTKVGYTGAGIVTVGTATGGTTGLFGTATWTASAGTLDLIGAVNTSSGTNKIALAVASGSPSRLKLDGTAKASSIALSSANQTLEIGSAGGLTLSAKETATGGTFKLDGGTLTDTAGLVLNAAAAHLSGFGTVNAALSGAGTVTASGGTLDIISSLAAATKTAFRIDTVANSVMTLDGTVGAGTAIGFNGGGNTLKLTHFGIGVDAIGFDGTVSGLTQSTTKNVATNQIDIANDRITKATVSGKVISLFDVNGQSGKITLGTAPGGFVNFVSDGGTGTNVFLASVVCFAAGTAILTDRGEVPVETIAEGDWLITVEGGRPVPRSVKWIGHRRIDLTRHSNPGVAAPIRIRRGAIAENVPHKDLLVSPDHAIYFDGLLIMARQLVNGTSIFQESGFASISYFHIELDIHAILLAEGLPAESYLDTGNRGFFANANDPLVLHPDLGGSKQRTTRDDGACAPLVVDEASVRPVWKLIAERAAGGLGGLAGVATTSDPDLRLVVDECEIRAVAHERGIYTFVVRDDVTAVRLVSRSNAPTDIRPWLEDRRRLGVRVKRIILRDRTEFQEIALDHPRLSDGWWDPERDGPVMRRWTDGAAILPLPRFEGEAILEIHIGDEATYSLGCLGKAENDRWSNVAQIQRAAE